MKSDRELSCPLLPPRPAPGMPPWAPRLPSMLLCLFLLLRRLFLAGLTHGLSGFPFLLRSFFLMLDSEL